MGETIDYKAEVLKLYPSAEEKAVNTERSITKITADLSCECVAGEDTWREAYLNYCERSMPKAEAKRLFTLELVKAMACDWIDVNNNYTRNELIVRLAISLSDACEQKGLL